MNSFDNPKTKHGNIQNNVLTGLDRYLFLHEGNYNQFSFLTGNSKPSKDSKENFIYNLRSRRLFAESQKIPYLHVIFPCKPLVAKDKIPKAYRDGIKSLFLSSYATLLDGRNPIKERVLYPLAALLRVQIQEDAYWRNDTHINAAGQISIYHEIGKYIPYLSTTFPQFRLVDMPRSGDLSLMMGSKTQEMSRCFAWMGECLDYSNTRDLAGNTGDIVIRFNPLSKSEKRLAIVGDSFIKTMLHLFSQDFRTVMYVRGPYFQPEMIERFCPDALVTSETERYLAGVDSDRNGKSLYPKILKPEKNYKPNSDFKEALEAQMSYQNHPNLTKEWEKDQLNKHQLKFKGFGSAIHNQQLVQIDNSDGKILEVTGECPVIHIHSIKHKPNNFLAITIESHTIGALLMTILREDENMSTPLENFESEIQTGEQIIYINTKQYQTITGLLLQPLNCTGQFIIKHISWKKDVIISDKISAG